MYKKDLKIIRLLLEHGVDMKRKYNGKDQSAKYKGKTVLFVATKRKQAKVVEIFEEYYQK